MSYESTETKEFEMRRDMDILEIFSVTCVICQGHKKREREIVRCNDTVAIQRFHLTFVFKKMVNVATNDAFFPRASLLNAIVQQVESPARESMETSVMDVIATRNVSVFITFFYVEKKNSRFDNANNRASFAIARLSTSFIVPFIPTDK